MTKFFNIALLCICLTGCADDKDEAIGDPCWEFLEPAWNISLPSQSDYYIQGSTTGLLGDECWLVLNSVFGDASGTIQTPDGTLSAHERTHTLKVSHGSCSDGSNNYAKGDTIAEYQIHWAAVFIDGFRWTERVLVYEETESCSILGADCDIVPEPKTMVFAMYDECETFSGDKWIMWEPIVGPDENIPLPFQSNEATNATAIQMTICDSKDHVEGTSSCPVSLSPVCHPQAVCNPEITQ